MLGLRLLLLAWWTPKYIIRKELKNISDQTTTALKTLLTKNTLNSFNIENQKQQTCKKY